ncbi:helix-turn-helix domain-containing protein [Pedobacter sp. MC2016-24]|uniref:helix-turn-helix domain-containing protein n=1 Tax=Pedobacter sp. MC2016-24 TaxID=2780090 RepID=UPI00351CB57D
MINVRNQQIINALGDRVRALRKAKNMSMEKLAEHAGIDYRQVFNIEHGKTNATVSTLHNISKALDISISELFDIDSLK